MCSTNDLFCSSKAGGSDHPFFQSHHADDFNPLSMAKWPMTSKDAPPRQRKWWRNGVSSTTQVLDFAPPPLPPTVEVMRVWHRNNENSEVAWESNTLIPKPRDPPPLKRTIQFEALDVTDMSYSATPRPKRKNRNNSVSLFFNPTSHMFLNAKSPSRQKWKPGSPSGQQYWMKSYATMVFKIMTVFPHVLIVTKRLVPSGAAIVPK